MLEVLLVPMVTSAAARLVKTAIGGDDGTDAGALTADLIGVMLKRRDPTAAATVSYARPLRGLYDYGYRAVAADLPRTRDSQPVRGQHDGVPRPSRPPTVVWTSRWRTGVRSRKGARRNRVGSDPIGSRNGGSRLGSGSLSARRYLGTPRASGGAIVRLELRLPTAAGSAG